MEKLSQQLDNLAEAFERMADATEIEDKDIYKCQICRDCGWIIENGTARPCSCRSEQKQEKLLPIPHLRNMRFEDFDIRLYPEDARTERGKSYRQLANDALYAAMDFAADISAGKNRPGLIFEGDVGSGKTFLAAAIANHLLEKGIDVEFAVVPEFLDDLRRSMYKEGDEDSRLVDRAKNIPVLILDDMGAHNFSPWVQNMLFTVINYRLNHRLPMIITTNLDLEHMEEAFGERIVSRMLEIGTNIKLFIDKDIRLKLYRNGRDRW